MGSKNIWKIFQKSSSADCSENMPVGTLPKEILSYGSLKIIGYPFLDYAPYLKLDTQSRHRLCVMHL